MLGGLSLLVFFSRGKISEGQNHFKALGIAALGFLYVAVAPFIGYFIAITALAGGAALYYGAPRRLAVLIFSMGTAGVLWLVFRVMLGIALP